MIPPLPDDAPVCLTLREPAGYLRLRLRTRVSVFFVIAVAAACARQLPEPVPIARPAELAERLREGSTPGEARHIIFDWRYRGREGRFSGEGGVRYNPPDSARLDLLGPGWSGVQSAVLLGEDVYYRGEQRITLPPPTFMWTMMGVFRPPPGVEPDGVRREDRIELTYDLIGARAVTFVFDTLGHLTEARLAHEGATVEEIQLEPGATDASDSTVPHKARYRDLRDFHEVSIDVSEVRRREPFEGEIFRTAVR